MKIIDEARFHDLVALGEIKQRNCEFLDGLKIGLRIKPRGTTLGPIVNFADPGRHQRSFDFQTMQMQSHVLYLAETLEQLTISNRMFGLLHTRSRIARFGLEAVGGANYVAPGFGNGEPKSLVLEMRAANSIVGFTTDLPVAGLLLFELEIGVRIGLGAPNNFPFLT